ncbi:MAG: hypothetical protein IT178_03400 [Acidobacteria bacterium]|nr:hypothetical protein [Acidobacteriota bacterium]
MVMVLLGAVLTLLGIGGAMNAAMAGPEDRDFVVSLMSGMAFAGGIILMALGAARHGYHRRPLGAPPGDADPDKVSDPAPNKM